MYGVLTMISSDILLTISSLLFVGCAIPQVIRNLQFKDTITQSILTNCFIFIGATLTLIAYWNLKLFIPSLFILIEVIITGILIIQIVYWKSHRKDKRIKKLVSETENIRSLVRTVKGVK
jgi:ABC-type Fe3+-siderophore transport system permease subunit